MALDPKQLPGELEACHALIAQLAQELDLRDLKVRKLQHQLEQLLRWRYGRKSERVDENQMFFEAMAMVNAATAPASDTPSAVPTQESAATPAAAPAANPRGHGRQRLPAHLPRERIVYDVPEEQRHCPHCSETARHIGEEICERLEYVPASLTVIQEVCQKYACPKGCTVLTAEKPMAPIEKGLPGPGLIAHVAVSKYADHQPLARQQEQWHRQGVELARSTMCGWMHRGAALVTPLYDLMTQRVLSSKAVQTDDTPVAVLDPELSHTRQGRIWSYVGDPANPFTVYAYTPTRAGEGPSAFLENYSGYLQADAYAGYDAIFNDNTRDIIELACWAHARRRFFEAQTSDLMRSMIVLAYVRLLYDVEREAKDADCTGEARRVLRQQKSLPILADIEAYLRREQSQVLPKSPIADAIGYALNNWPALKRYCDDGDLEIDNNGAERSLRGVAVGRRNWTFFGSDRGGHTAAILTSLIATCKRLHIDPFAYLRDIFQRISAHPASRLAELLPDQWKAAPTANSS